MEGALEGAHRILFFVGDRDDPATSWHLEDVVAIVSHCHELGQGRIPKDGIVWRENVGDVKVNELGVVVVVLSKGDGEVGLPYRDSGTISDS